jgi:hypothetical protein
MTRGVRPAFVVAIAAEIGWLGVLAWMAWRAAA